MMIKLMIRKAPGDMLRAYTWDDTSKRVVIPDDEIENFRVDCRKWRNDRYNAGRAFASNMRKEDWIAWLQVHEAVSNAAE